MELFLKQKMELFFMIFFSKKNYNDFSEHCEACPAKFIDQISEEEEKNVSHLGKQEMDLFLKQ